MAEKFPHTDTGEEVAAASNDVLFPFVKSIFWTVKGHLHEFGKADYPSDFNQAGNLFNDFSQFRAGGADLAIGRKQQ